MPRVYSLVLRPGFIGSQNSNIYAPDFRPVGYLALKFQLRLIFSATKHHEKQNFLPAGSPFPPPSVSLGFIVGSIYKYPPA